MRVSQRKSERKVLESAQSDAERWSARVRSGLRGGRVWPVVPLAISFVVVWLGPWRMAGELRSGSPYLEHRGFYAPAEGDAGRFVLGYNTQSTIRLGDVDQPDVAHIVRQGDRFFVVPGATLPAVRWEDGPSEGALDLEIDRSYTFTRGNVSIRMVRRQAIHARIQPPIGVEEELFIPPVPGESAAAGFGELRVGNDQRLQLLLLTAGQPPRVVATLATPGSANVPTTAGGWSIRWLPPKDDDPAAFTWDDGSSHHAIVLPGASLYLPTVGASIFQRQSGGVFGRLRWTLISTALPTGAGRLIPLIAGRTILEPVQGTLRRKVRLGTPTYYVEERRLGGRPWLMMQRIPGDALRVARLSFDSLADYIRFRSFADRALYHPTRPIPIPDCSGNHGIPALWVAPAEDEGRRLSPRFATSPLSRSSAQTADTAFAVHRVAAAHWIPQTRRGGTISLCRTASKEIRASSLDSSGSGHSPFPDAVLRGGTDITSQWDRAGGTLRPGDLLFDAGRIYAVEPEGLPGAIQAAMFLFPLVLWSATAPLLLYTGVRQREVWRRICTSERDPLGRFAVGFVVASPSTLILLIQGLMSLGAMFHLKMAGTGLLIGTPANLATFVAATVLAWSFATGLALAIQRPASRWSAGLAGLLGSVTLSLLSISAAEPLLLRLLNVEIRPPTGADAPVAWIGWALTLMSGVGAAFFFVRARRIETTERTLWANRVERGIRWLGRTHRNYLESKPWAGPMKSQRRVVISACFLIGSAVLRSVSWMQKDATRWFGRAYQRCLGTRPWPASVKWMGSEKSKRRIVVSAFFLAGPILLLVGILWLPKLLSKSAEIVGKEFLPPLIVLNGAWVAERASYFIQREDSQGLPLAASYPWFSLMAAAVFATIFLGPATGIASVNSPILSLALSGILLACMGLLATEWFEKSWAMLLAHLIPFFIWLLLVAVAFKDFGSVLVWTWALSFLGGWCVVTNFHLMDNKNSVRKTMGAVVTTASFALLPSVMLGMFNYIRWAWPWVLAEFQRPVERFRLADSPFYYNAGEWLARVQVMATKTKPASWIPNMNSDVALNSFQALSGESHAASVFVLGLVVILATLAALFLIMYRTAAVEGAEREEGAPSLKASLFVAAALFGLSMLLIVHLGASVFDSLPLTGVPCPWLSHANLTHVVMTALVVVTSINCLNVLDKTQSGRHRRRSGVR